MEDPRSHAVPKHPVLAAVASAAIALPAATAVGAPARRPCRLPAPWRPTCPGPTRPSARRCAPRRAPRSSTASSASLAPVRASTATTCAPATPKRSPPGRRSACAARATTSAATFAACAPSTASAPRRPAAAPSRRRGCRRSGLRVGRRPAAIGAGGTTAASTSSTCRPGARSAAGDPAAAPERRAGPARRDAARRARAPASGPSAAGESSARTRGGRHGPRRLRAAVPRPRATAPTSTPGRAARSPAAAVGRPPPSWSRGEHDGRDEGVLRAMLDLRERQRAAYAGAARRRARRRRPDDLDERGPRPRARGARPAARTTRSSPRPTSTPACSARSATLRARRGVASAPCRSRGSPTRVGPRTRLVACSHVSWVDRRARAGRAGARPSDVPVLLDGAQGVGAVPVDVERARLRLLRGRRARSGCAARSAPGCCGSRPAWRDAARRRSAPTYLNLDEPGAGLDAAPRRDARRHDASAHRARGRSPPRSPRTTCSPRAGLGRGARARRRAGRVARRRAGRAAAATVAPRGRDDARRLGGARPRRRARRASPRPA